LNVLMFDFKWGMVFLIFTLIYVPLYYYSDKYLCSTPCSRCSPLEEWHNQQELAELRRRKKLNREIKICCRWIYCKQRKNTATTTTTTAPPPSAAAKNRLTMQQVLAKSAPTYSAAGPSLASETQPLYTPTTTTTTTTASYISTDEDDEVEREDAQLQAELERQEREGTDGDTEDEPNTRSKMISYVP